MEQFAALGSVAFKLHMELKEMYFLLLPVFFMASVALVWLQNPTGGPEFLDKIKRAFVATLLLVGFAEISDAMLFITNGVADKIDNMSGLAAVMQMASEKAHSYTMNPLTPILAFDDLLMAGLSYLSYAVLYCARFIMVALYHFSWIFLTIMAPILLLFHVFSSQVTVNLFRSMFEVASWKVVWSILSVILKSLPFGTWYAMEGAYLTIIVLNFVIAICMVGTPLVVRSLFGNGFAAMAGGLTGATAAAMLAGPAKAMAVTRFGRGMLGDVANFGRGINSRLGQNGEGFGNSPRAPPPNMRTPFHPTVQISKPSTPPPRTSPPAR
jgi:hypothetical protein